MTTSSPASYPSLEDRHVFITGGASGIGAELVTQFAGQNANVTFVDVQADQGAELARSLGERGSFVECDITDTVALQEQIRLAIEQRGPITVLVNNAANDDRHDWQDVTPEYWDSRTDINLKPMFFTIQAVAPAMIDAGGGSIINFGSSSWMIKASRMAGYTASKAAVHGITRSFANELGRHNIRVNTIVPGWVMTDRQVELWLDEAGERSIARNQTLPGRLLSTHVAAMALFLAADDSAMCSAQQFIVDGGWV